jgi:PTH1 family peptidyl-tRNA hydrolase
MSNDVTFHFILPTSYMNESGRVVQRYLSFFRLTPADLTVVADDIALPFGSLRLRSGGSSGGHNGLKNIEAHLGSQQYIRLRIGVGSPNPSQELADYVLQRFSPPELEQLPEVLLKGVAALEVVLAQNVEAAMNLVNSKDWQWRNLNHES